MACFSRLLVSLLVVIINLLRTECVGTRAVKKGLIFDEESNSTCKCFRRCRSIIKDREKRTLITFEKCMQDCKQGRSLKEKEDDHAPSKFRIQRSIEENKKCLGLSDPRAVSPFRAEIVKVEFKSIASDKHSYKVFWKPLKEFRFDFYNLTHYSLVYQFEHNQSPDGKMKCVLVPRNATSWTLTDHAPNIKPDILHVAVVSYPFRGTHLAEKITLFSYDPLRPTFIPTFIPVFEKRKEAAATKAIVAWAPIAGGSVAGVILLVILLLAIIWRRSALCPSNYQDPVIHQAVIARPNNIRERATERTAAVAVPSADISCELYYSCYYPENDAFRDDVASIVNKFRENGYDVIMDAMASSEISSQGPTRWAENQIRRAKKVLVFLSPGLLKLACVDGCGGIQSQDINRVWIELEVLRDLYTQTLSAAKMVCITLPDVPVTSRDLPRPVWWKVSYKWPEDFQEILKRLNDRPLILPGERILHS